jgi:hypothetical protein
MDNNKMTSEQKSFFAIARRMNLTIYHDSDMRSGIRRKISRVKGRGVMSADKFEEEHYGT